MKPWIPLYLGTTTIRLDTPEIYALNMIDLNFFHVEELQHFEKLLMREMSRVSNNSYEQLVTTTLHRISIHLNWIEGDEVPL